MIDYKPLAWVMVCAYGSFFVYLAASRLCFRYPVLTLYALAEAFHFFVWDPYSVLDNLPHEYSVLVCRAAMVCEMAWRLASRVPRTERSFQCLFGLSTGLLAGYWLFRLVAPQTQLDIYRATTQSFHSALVIQAAIAWLCLYYDPWIPDPAHRRHALVTTGYLATFVLGILARNVMPHTEESWEQIFTVSKLSVLMCVITWMIYLRREPYARTT